MNNMVKVYEEIINEFYENPAECRIWLNEMLDDEAIPYRNEIKVKGDSNDSPINFDTNVVLEIYVYESDVNRALNLIEQYNNAEISNEYEELNISPEDLKYYEDDE